MADSYVWRRAVPALLMDRPTERGRQGPGPRPQGFPLARDSLALPALPSRRAAEIDSHSRRMPESPSLSPVHASAPRLAGLDAIKGLG